MISLNINSIIVDDEANGRENINILLKEFCPEVEIVGVASNLREAESLIKEKRPQLVFLDIQMPKINGFEMLELVQPMPAVIFITAFDEFALKAFEANAIDYLLKPVAEERFEKAIHKKGLIENLSVLKFSLNESSYKKLTWENNKEFQYQNEMYDLVFSTIHPFYP